MGTVGLAVPDVLDGLPAGCCVFDVDGAEGFETGVEGLVVDAAGEALPVADVEVFDEA